ncbi:hypothetical protein BXT86_02090 [candidate division WOR-3 bacterium 4484_100]|uniref:RNA polymerase subunit sigma-70 n=1 Tax=candidate division WOR-3 bacterium 4484_100 TaxID=1936077 RepID=A0A1V4QHC1_UNCW3|nr:MAG: hypothetical protein BXT86_02090 [candidate division WOR-3 bacterium 4484_100]
MNGNEDIQLVQDFKSGDEKAFDRLFEKYQGSVYSLCYRYTRNESDAKEVCQDVFIKVYNNLKKFNEKSKFFTWLYRITVNTCISFRRRNRSVQQYEPEAMVSMDQRIRMKIAINDALRKLPKRQRMVFLLHHYEGYTFDEVGDIMGISTGTAKANHYHAIRKLRELLKEWI